MNDNQNESPKITFLFGAGAEHDYGLPTGETFLQPLLTDEYNQQREELLGNKYQQYRLVYPQSQKVFWKAIAAHPDEASGIFGNDEKDKAIAKENEHNEKISLTEECKIWYNIITKIDNLSVEEKKIREFFLEYAVFFESLDERFHYLQDGNCSSVQAKRVKNAYVTIFIELFSEIYLKDCKETFVWNWENVLHKVKEKQPVSCGKETYYQQLQEKSFDYNIATTNYTDFAKETTGKEIVYLHGNLHWFEDLKALTIYDAQCERDFQKLQEIKNPKDSGKMPDNILPFILIPSGVKPLICVKQIEEFHKFKKMLEDSEILCVVGYAFNSEDNHVNAIIGDWLRQNKKRKLVFLDYEGKIKWERLLWLEQFYRKKLPYDNKSDVLNCAEQIITLSADKDSSKAHEIFDSWIQEFETKYSSKIATPS